jgi:hypothetical protein
MRDKERQPSGGIQRLDKIISWSFFFFFSSQYSHHKNEDRTRRKKQFGDAPKKPANSPLGPEHLIFF